MQKTFTGQFDGKVIVLDKKVKLPIGKRLRIKIELAPNENGKKKGKPRKIAGAGQFDSGIPDLATNKKHMEGFGESESKKGKKNGKPFEIIGTGQFHSGIPDLATNKKYMEGFGES